MADNQTVLNRAKEDDFLAEDDPLAELARIAGIERPGNAARGNSMPRHEPEFDLEDELLREFELYDAPQRDQSGAQPAHAQPMSKRFEPVFEAFGEAEPEPESTEPAPVIEPIEALAASGPDHEPDAEAAMEAELLAALDPFVAYSDSHAEPAEVVAEPALEVEEDALADADATSLKDQSAEEDQPDEPAWLQANREIAIESASEQPVEELSDGAEAAAAEAPWDPEAAFAATIAEMRSAPEYQEETDFSVWDDLFVDKQPGSAAEGMAADAAPAGEAAAGSVDEAAVPISNAPEKDLNAGISEEEEWLPETATATRFGTDDQQDWTPEQEAAAEMPDLAAEEFETETVDHSGGAAQVAEEFVPEEIAVEPGRFEPAASVQPEEVAAKRTDFTIDDLLAEVERFPMPATGPDWMRPETSRAAEKMRQEPAADVEPSVWEADSEHGAESAEASVPRIVEEGQPSPSTVATLELSENDNPFDESDFEIDIGAIELDLAEAVVPAPVAVAEIPTTRYPYQSDAAVGIQPTRALADIARLDVEDRWASPASEDRAASRSDIGDTSGLPFDPSQIGDTDEPLEQVADLDVPHLPVDHDDQPARAPEFDIDIDSEMAKIYAMPLAAAPSSPPRVVDRQISSNPSPGAYATTDNIDDFERALEEDFRRSMAPEIAGTGTPDRVALLPEGDQRLPDAEPRSKLPVFAAAGVVAVLVAGGVGLYAYMFDGASLISGTDEPRVIMADKEPFKQKPVDTGGQTVPNQDKAVYDKVAGAATEVPKQENLVSSTEEPIDVVQKTLVPETLLSGEDGPETTPTEDTTDPRLLPEGMPADEAAASNPVPGVQPRKVRTMIVKPDGTLVPREESAVEPVIAPAEADKLASAEAPAEDAAVVPERLPGADKQQSEVAADEKVAEAAAPVEAAAEDKQPVETAPIETAVEKPAEAAAKTTEIAAVEPAADAAALDAAANTTVDETAPVRVVKTQKITANAPVPETRPADQEVNVVSTVTDQGNVKEGNVPAETPAAETQQAALPAGTYVVQIASLPSEAEARKSYETLSKKFSGVIGGRGVDIRKAEISGKGTFYRVRIPAGSKNEAVELCQRYKKAGGSCLVSK